MTVPITITNGGGTVAGRTKLPYTALYGWLEDGNPSTGPTLPGVNSINC